MKKGKKRRVIIILTVIGVLFGLYNLIWYFTTQSKYGNYIDHMDEFVANRSYILNPGDGYLYNVKYPDYLTFTGNLGISDDNHLISLIIWPSFIGENKYGVRITDNDNVYEVMLDKEMKAKESENNEIIDKHIGEIQEMFQKADEQWDIIE